MPEYIVDCEHLPYGDDTRHECQLRKYSRHYTEPDKYCSEARPRDGDRQ